MSEEEELGRIAYEAYEQAARDTMLWVPHVDWQKVHEEHRKLWIAVAKAVAARVLQEVQVAEEASE